MGLCSVFDLHNLEAGGEENLELPNNEDISAMAKEQAVRSVNLKEFG